MRNIEKTNNSKTWTFFEDLRNFENFFIFEFDNLQTSEILAISRNNKLKKF